MLNMSAAVLQNFISKNNKADAAYAVSALFDICVNYLFFGIPIKIAVQTPRARIKAAEKAVEMISILLNFSG